jgi:hypothetical protein
MKIDIGTEFSHDPIGRYRSDSKVSGEAFREDFLKPALERLQEGENLTVVLDNDVQAYGSSFLDEGFAGAVRLGYISAQDFLKILEFEYSDEDYEFYSNRIREYVAKAG